LGQNRVIRLALLLLLLPFGSAFAGEVREQRRVWSNGEPQEVWYYDGSIDPDRLLRKESFYEDGQRKRIVRAKAGVQHGQTQTWYPDGSKESEEGWHDGIVHGRVTRWPNPGGDAEYSKKLKPDVEESYEHGVPHGRWRLWEDVLGDRFLLQELTYVQGQFDGDERVWHRKGELARHHRYVAGKLQGVQQGWHSDGSMAYEYRFEDDQLHGVQRQFRGDALVQELHLDRGVLHGEQAFGSWQVHNRGFWDRGQVTMRYTDEESGALTQIARFRYEFYDRYTTTGQLQVHGRRKLVDRQSFGADGRMERYYASVPDGFQLEFWPSGRVKLVGQGTQEKRHGRVLVFYEDGTLQREEHWATGRRASGWTTWDPQGRLASVEVWGDGGHSMVVTTWHSGDQKATEGDVEPAKGRDAFRKVGTWTYWTPDGRTLRTEEYTAAKRSGGPSVIESTTEWDVLGRVRFEGSGSELVLYDYDPDDPELVVRRRTVDLLDRNEFGLERWDPDTLSIVRGASKPIQEDKLHADALRVELLGSTGVVRSATTWRSDGSKKALRVFSRYGQWDGKQRGWYRNGQLAYLFRYRDSLGISEAQEFWPDGSPRLVGRFRRSSRSGVIPADLTIFNERGRKWEIERLQDPFRGPPELLDACALWRVEPDLARPPTRRR